MNPEISERMTVDDVLPGYLECAVWASTDLDSDEGESLDYLGYTVDDFTEAAIRQAREDIEGFLSLCDPDDLAGLDPEQVGHDFWLTRNHHGAGFWDRGLGALGDRLTEIAQTFGSEHVLPDTDGELHFYG